MQDTAAQGGAYWVRLAEDEDDDIAAVAAAEGYDVRGDWMRVRGRAPVVWQGKAVVADADRVEVEAVLSSVEEENVHGVHVLGLGVARSPSSCAHEMVPPASCWATWARSKTTSSGRTESCLYEGCESTKRLIHVAPVSNVPSARR